MEGEKPRKEKIAERFKRRLTSILKKRKRKKSNESDTPDPQLPRENSSSEGDKIPQRVELPGISHDGPEEGASHFIASEGDEMPQRVELPGISHDEPEQQQDISSPEEESQATQANDEKLLKDMPSEGYQKLVMLLQPSSATGRDYRSLADKMGYPNQYIQYLESTNDPVMTLITKYQREGRKISELRVLLNKMERFDVLEELQPFIDATPTPREIERHQQRLEEIEELRTIHDSYDAFVCFAKDAEKDNDFVNKLVKKMEGPPYNLRLCLSERDFLGGGCHLETTAVAIEKRCKKLVAVLSTNFEKSEGASYESHIAMSLSPGAKKERYIPVLIEDAYRDKIPRTIQHLYYLDYMRIEEPIFWERLASSLGWTLK